ncbi:MAG: hypothetical protein KAG14_00980 [Mycoplasmataceae bacterium]|nr:hypothetical protein [Mycoplasmataceae bacterium]
MNIFSYIDYTKLNIYISKRGRKFLAAILSFIFIIFLSIIALMILVFLVSKGHWMSTDDFTAFSKGKRTLTLAPLYILAFAIIPMAVAGALTLYLINSYSNEIKNGIKTTNNSLFGLIIMWLLSISSLLIIGAVTYWAITLSNNYWWNKNGKNISIYHLIMTLFVWGFTSFIFALGLFATLLLALKRFITNKGIRSLLPKDATKFDIQNARKIIKKFDKQTIQKNRYIVSNDFIK